MDFLVFSDSHGRTSGMREALSRNARVDAVFFLGDGLRDVGEVAPLTNAPWISVRGNCDSPRLTPDACEEESLCFEGHRILLVHGHTYGVKSGLGALIARAKAGGYDIVLYGHTHEPSLTCITEGDRPIYLFCPGSIGLPNAGAPCFGHLHLDEKNVLLSHGTV